MVVIGGLLALTLGGCTSDEPATDEGQIPVDGSDEELDLGAKPDLLSVLPDDRGDPPGSLRWDDLVEGGGEPAEPGDEITVHFVGAAWSSGREFDATWDRGQPYTFTLGVGEVIPGWDEGLEGMRVGGRRSLIIPPELAYGDRGSAAGIGPGETIAFIVDLLEVQGG